MAEPGLPIIVDEDVPPGMFRMVTEPSMRLDSIKEGICPQHDTPLERRDDCGWCSECGSGYSIEPGTVTLHFAFRAAGGTQNG